jgi:hypothetical protein
MYYGRRKETIQQRNYVTLPGPSFPRRQPLGNDEHHGPGKRQEIAMQSVDIELGPEASGRFVILVGNSVSG